MLTSPAESNTPLCELLEARLLLSTVDVSGTIYDDLNVNGTRDGGEPPAVGVTVFADQDGNGVLNTLAFTEQMSPAAPIPDASVTTYMLDVVASAPVADLNVHLDITHPLDSDLDVYLISPTGTRVELFTDVGDGSGDFSGTVLDDEAAIGIDDPGATAPFTGVYRPEGVLASFDGEAAGGTWTLEITDDTAGSVGTLNQWALEFAIGDLTTVTDAAGEYRLDALPAGPMEIRPAPGALWRLTSPAIIAPAAGSLAGADVGIAADGIVSGVVYVDDNGDGIYNEPVGVPDRRVYVDADANGLIDAASDNWGDSRNFVVANRGFAAADITVSGLGGIVRRVSVTIDIDHTYVGDLTAWLFSPAGTRVELLAGVGAGGDNFQFTVFDDDALVAIGDGTAPFSGTYRPTGQLGDFAGEDPNGTWRLLVADTVANGIAGTLDNWSLSLDTGDLEVFTDAGGAYASGPLPAGPYSIRAERQDGWLTTAPTGGAHDVWLGSGQDLPDADFGSAQAGSLAGNVWHDADANGSTDPGESPLAGWQVFLDANNDGMVNLWADQAFANAAVTPVPDLGTMTSAMVISGATGRVLDVKVRVSIDHTYVSDLDVFLISPQGTRVELFTDIGDSGENLTDVWLDDEAGQDIAAATAFDAPFTGTWRAEAPLAGFDGEIADGTWFLEVSDDAGWDTGTLISWDLVLTTGDPTTVTDANGDYSFDPVLPGESTVRLVLDAAWPAMASGTDVRVVQLGSGVAGTGHDFGARVAGDMDGDLDVDATDVDALAAAVNGGSSNPLYDVNGDGQVTTADIDELIEGVIGTSYGDSDLDGDVDLDDFVTLKKNFTTGNSWAQGDSDLDGDVDLDDFVLLKKNFGGRRR